MKFNTDKYELIQKKTISELQSEGFYLRHKKSGAGIVILENNDENKVFAIGFRTPPSDSTGVPHILEHSVLCGSEKYPAKEPFVELAKGSLNTFLNAMTYPDKTVYPIASCNDTDFKNIMDVYMDAVLHPNIYSRKQIFMQEGWHYELESIDGPLTYNGVVYNEMKGAFSSPDEVLARYCLNSLYPDTSYGTESGGDPEKIPELTYEAFLDFHKKLYHPSNSYIYIYGNCDMEERLEYLDREYLSAYDRIDVDSNVEFQKPFDKMKRVEAEYSITRDESPEGKTYFAYNASVETSLNKELYLAFQILDYALLSAPGAPVKQALIDAGIGEDVFSYYENGIKQPMFSIIAKNAGADREQDFIRIIKETLQNLVEKGLNKDTLRAGINSNEFYYREGDYGRTPKGLVCGIGLMDSWLYDDNQPFLLLEMNETYEFLKSKVETDYFEQLIDKYLIKNTHASLVVLKPVVNLTADNDRKTALKLEQYKKSLSKEELLQIVEETKALKEYQKMRSTPEELATIPMLSRDDISRDIQPLYNNTETVEGVLFDHHEIFTNGIGYLSLSFDISNVEDRDIPYVGLLNSVIGYIDTKYRSYEELSNDIDMNTGGIIAGFNTYQDISEEKVTARDSIKCKALMDKLPRALDIIREIMYVSLYDDHKRLKEILAETKSRLQSKFISAGHATARGECMAQFSLSARYTALTSGVPFYNFIADLYDNFDNKKNEITRKLQLITGQIFVKDRLIVSFTGTKEDYLNIKPELKNFVRELLPGGRTAAERSLKADICNIGYQTASQVNYVARCGDFKEAGLKYDASLKVLANILSYNYLWDNVRVLGGAYGCMCGFTVNGVGYFTSYRDPEIDKTNQIYEAAVEFVKNFDADDSEMTKYILGTFGEMDIPLTPSAKAERSFDFFLRGVTEEFLKADRIKALNTVQDDIRSLAPYIEAIMKENYLCVIGNADKIEDNKELFDKITNLY
ncbi:MAG: insulinase family protein [Butyrivibrio sp.]